ncbi:MAG: flagellar basal body protein, partial [Bacillota bacterium]|nr:flagellar basal body protein [Bacillota bacterium]
MSSTFYGLEIASKALFAAQKGLEVTGHNVANADTVGYSRQRLNTSSVEAGSGYVRFASAQKGQIGGGV